MQVLRTEQVSGGHIRQAHTTMLPLTCLQHTAQVSKYLPLGRHLVSVACCRSRNTVGTPDKVEMVSSRLLLSARAVQPVNKPPRYSVSPSLILLDGSSHHGLLTDLPVFDPGSNLSARLIDSSPCLQTQLWTLATIERSIRTATAPARRQTDGDKTVLIETKDNFERLACGVKYTRAAGRSQVCFCDSVERRDQTRPSSPDSNLWRISIELGKRGSPPDNS